MNSPFIVWQRGALRIVAVETDGGPALAVEHRQHDALGAERWDCVLGLGSNTLACAVVDTLAMQVASTVDVMPTWVQRFVRSAHAEDGEVDELVCGACGEAHSDDDDEPHGAA